MNENLQLLQYMLEDVRKVTLNGIKDLSKDQLYEKPLGKEFPIGSYIMHLAECEIFWLEVLSGITQPEDLKKRSYYDVWYDAFKDPSPPLSAPEISDYHEVLSEARKNLFDYMSTMKDSELEETVSFKSGAGEKSFSKKWIIYHLIEHEAHHRGQMFMLIRMAGMNKKK